MLCYHQTHLSTDNALFFPGPTKLKLGKIFFTNKTKNSVIENFALVIYKRGFSKAREVMNKRRDFKRAMLLVRFWTVRRPAWVREACKEVINTLGLRTGCDKPKNKNKTHTHTHTHTQKKKTEKKSKGWYLLIFGGCQEMNDLFQCQWFLFNNRCSLPPAPTVHTFSPQHFTLNF